MITEKDIQELEERFARHFHNMDTMTVNLIRGEIANLRNMFKQVTEEVSDVEEKLVVKPIRGKTKQAMVLDELHTSKDDAP